MDMLFKKGFLGIALLVFSFSVAQAQEEVWLNGKVLDSTTLSPLPFVNVVTEIAGEWKGCITDEKGVFSLGPLHLGKYTLTFSSLGYATRKETMQLNPKMPPTTIWMSPSAETLDEVVLIAEVDRNTTGMGVTSYTINKEVQANSFTATDVVKFIPGITVDLNKTIRYQGTGNLRVRVNGVDRPLSYLKRLDMAFVKRVEVLENDSSVAADVGVVLNFIVSKANVESLYGNLVVDIPTRSDLVYAFPSLDLGYSMGKLDIFASYNGEWVYLDQKNKESKTIFDQDVYWQSHMEYDQRNTAQTGHFGLSYPFSKQWRLDYYGTYTYFSNELIGAFSQYLERAEETWEAQGERWDDDANREQYHALTLNGENELWDYSLNTAFSDLRASRNTAYVYADQTVKADQETAQTFYKLRFDTGYDLKEKGRLKAGLYFRYRHLNDPVFQSFDFKEWVGASYIEYRKKWKNWGIKIGTRGEFARTSLGQAQVSDRTFNVLPTLVLEHDIKQAKLFVTYAKKLFRPSWHQLNPSPQFHNPVTIQRGNPELRPAINHYVEAKYSYAKNDNRYQWALFYGHTQDVQGLYTHIQPEGYFLDQAMNLGARQSIGAFLNTQIALGKNMDVGGFIKTSYDHTEPLKALTDSSTREGWVIEGGGSLLYSRATGWQFALNASANSPRINFQGKTRADVLYFVSIQKALNKNFTLAVNSGLPFAKRFNSYTTTKTASDFYTTQASDVALPALPLWFKMNYSFGKKKNGRNDTREESVRPSNGF
ncbi:outer membrane beta-barrel family protein [Sediminicola luteus]|uniref:Outer membrane protein beta-barrel domain-containing protein n=1 Tax=Sediminicola luteus TaxID=319238 RepID=A0A2A4G7I0_9FLAO|nr:outer membrane beta-barrel family protein [Sediminicola luteus]PCE63938.1 hypothetical protein B7P33_11840 [Sediminicola luteus]